MDGASVARQNNVDLIVLGVPGPDQADRAWWQSVASSVAANETKIQSLLPACGEKVAEGRMRPDEGLCDLRRRNPSSAFGTFSK
jgi:hypothetical protein